MNSCPTLLLYNISEELTMRIGAHIYNGRAVL